VYAAVGVRIDELPDHSGQGARRAREKSQRRNARVGPESFPDVLYPEPMLVPPPWEGGDGNSLNRARRTPAKKEAVA